MFSWRFMTLFFDLHNLETLCKGDDSKFLFYLRNFYNKSVPKQLKDKPTLNLAGRSFLLNPKPILKARPITDVVFIVQYIKLAGKRDYTFYKHYGDATLPLSYYPDLNYNLIKHNPLLKVDSNKLLFYYEENKGIK